jgi:hypothetical protein
VQIAAADLVANKHGLDICSSVFLQNSPIVSRLQFVKEKKGITMCARFNCNLHVSELRVRSRVTESDIVMSMSKPKMSAKFSQDQVKLNAHSRSWHCSSADLILNLLWMSENEQTLRCVPLRK